MWSHKMGLRCSCRKGQKKERPCILSLSCFSGKGENAFCHFHIFQKKNVFCHFHIFVGSGKN